MLIAVHREFMIAALFRQSICRMIVVAFMLGWISHGTVLAQQEVMPFDELAVYLSKLPDGTISLLEDTSKHYLLLWRGQAYECKKSSLASKDGWVYGWTIRKISLLPPSWVEYRFSHRKLRAREGYVDDVVSDVRHLSNDTLPKLLDGKIDEVTVPIDKLFAYGNWARRFSVKVPIYKRSSTVKINRFFPFLILAPYAIGELMNLASPGSVRLNDPVTYFAGWGSIWGCSLLLQRLVLQPREGNFSPQY